MIFDEYRAALGRYGVALTPSPRVLADLVSASRRGWTMRDLARETLLDWPDNVRSPAAMVRSRLTVLADVDPDPFPTPGPPRWHTPYTDPGVPMPKEIRNELRRKKWWREH